jgi:hypothetical protein
MIKAGPIALFSLLVLLSGCSAFDPHCPTPNKPSFTDYTCWWEVKITNINSQRGEVTGTLPYKGAEKFTFRVRDLDKLERNKQLEEGELYLFNNGHSSPYLEPFPKGETAR